MASPPGSPRRQHRLRIHDEFYGHGRYREPRLAIGVLNKLYGTRCLVSQATIAAAAQAVEAREIDRLVVAGQTLPQFVFEIMDEGRAVGRPDRFARALFRGARRIPGASWDEATRALKAALAAAPGDGPCMVLLARVESLRDNPPPADWDGSWRLDQKNPCDRTY